MTHCVGKKALIILNVELIFKHSRAQLQTPPVPTLTRGPACDLFGLWDRSRLDTNGNLKQRSAFPPVLLHLHLHQENMPKLAYRRETWTRTELP